jgi:hypothetical protein
MKAISTLTTLVTLTLLVAFTATLVPAKPARTYAPFPPLPIVSPSTPGPLVSQAGKLRNDAGEAGDLSGLAVAISGDTALVGAPNVGLSAGAAQGAVYVFVRSGSDWTLEATLMPDLPVAGSFFGTSVDLDGDTAIVGALFEDEGANARQGAAYVFERSAGVWAQRQRLVAGDPAANDLFGLSVALDGDAAIVGAPGGDADAAGDAGAVYAFARSGGLWSETQKLTASDAETGDQFGFGVALDAGTAAIGANGKDVNGAAASNAGAAYVFALSGATWTERQKLLPDLGAENDYFGTSVALGGDTAIVGAWGDDVGTNVDQGSAYVFARSGTVWTQQQQLTAADGSENDHFAFSVALAGDTAVIGALVDDVTYEDQGSAYVFSRRRTTWSEKSRLFAAGGSERDKMGTSVALDGDTILAGAPLVDVGANADQGSAAIFRISPGLVEEADLDGSELGADDLFGTSVDVIGDTMVVGAPLDDVGGNDDQGAVYVYVRDGDAWEEQARIVDPIGQAFDGFGFDVAVSGNVIAVGVPGDDIGANVSQGSVCVFVRTGSTWNFRARLLASDGANLDVFGWSVDVSGERIAVGAPGHAVGADAQQGQVYAFARSGPTWVEEDRLVATGGDAIEQMGYSVAVDGDTVIAGAWQDEPNGVFLQGSAYVFRRNGSSWSQEERLVASDGASGDRFGVSVAVSGDTAAVGASSKDVNGNASQGATYVFVRDGSSWVEQDSLVASDGAADTNFGAAVAVSGDRVLVGDFWATVDGNSRQGAAYLYVRHGTAWTEHQKLTAGDGDADDNFGRAVAISAETAVVGGDRDEEGADLDRGSAYVFMTTPGPALRVDPSVLPAATSGRSYTTAVATTDGAAPYNYSVSSGTLPPGLVFVPSTGRLYGTPTLAGTFAFTITATDANLSVGSRAYDFAVACPTVAVHPFDPNLASGAIGVAYAATFTGRGGRAPYAYALGLGTLPAGLALDPTTGVLSGTPTESGTFSLQVVATDSAGCAGAQEYVLTVECAAIALAPSKPRLVQGAVGSPYNQAISATGGTAPHTFAVVAGALPSGLTLDAPTGAIAGTPTAAGTFDFTVRATDATGCGGQKPYRIVVN